MDDIKLYHISKVNINDTMIEFNCRTIKPILLYVEEKYGRDILKKFIYDTQMNLEYLENVNNWISYAYFCRLLAKLVEYTGDPKAPFAAGLYASKKECFGAFETFLSRLGTPAGAYKLGTEFSARYTKIGGLKITDLKRNSCTAVSYYLDNYKQDKNNCLNVQGILASVPTLQSLPLAKIKEVQCAAEGADTCIYKLSWQNKPSHLFGLLGILTALIIVYGIKALPRLEMNTPFSIMILIMGYLIGRIKDYKITLQDNADFNEKEGKDLMESLETIEMLNIELQERVEERTKELQNALDELKKSQGRLIQSEKMASVGRLAAGMAHELNNPVGAIRNYIQDLLEDLSEGDSQWERLKRAEKATGRCKRLVSDLLTFSRENKELKLVDVNDIVETAVSNAKEEISNPAITILKKLEPDLPKIRIDPLQIQQVFMNIIMNASDAIKGEGQIAVKTSRTPETIAIDISDTGIGIPEEVQNKIFDPFFTTKAPGKGTGLGLAISYNIIKRFNGDIQVKSEKDKGAAFIVTLPVGDKAGDGVQERIR